MTRKQGHGKQAASRASNGRGTRATRAEPAKAELAKGDAKHKGRGGPAAAPRRQDKDEALEAFRERFEGSTYTTDHGIPVPQTDDSLKAGPRGPTLLEDFHLREKLTRFDHERIPERVVHARGSGAHGFFQVYESLEDVTAADFLHDPAARTPVFVRFSTVAGSRGSSDLARDIRGFATRFYTRQGNFDLVGNNVPVFFIQDGIKFPDLIHAVKPEPHNEMPQAASAHDTFWDFVSLVPETLHAVLWVMSDRGLPRSFRMMEGFGVHTFRLVNAKGRSLLAKFHWKPVLGAHSLLWDEAQKISGKDPDFHRRDLWDAIETGNYPEWELGLQLVPESKQSSMGFDMLDPTKLVPEELVPVRRVGKLTLDRNPDNFFAETEQVAFCVANIVPGVDFTNDPLMQARLFSYLDTQLLRLGGPNFAQLPINRPLEPPHNHQQDGQGQQRIPTGRALYHPNSVGANQPRMAAAEQGFVHFPEAVDGAKARERSPSFLDHFSQARMFLHSQSPPERAHLIEACRFELGKVERLAIRERVVALFAEVEPQFAAEVAAAVGVKPGKPARQPPVARPTGTPAPAQGREGAAPKSSPALSLANQPHPNIRTRKIALLAAAGVSRRDVDAVQGALLAAGACVDVVSTALGSLPTDEDRPCDVTKTFLTTASVLYDAVYVPGGAASLETLLTIEAARDFVLDSWRHAKPLGATNEGEALLLAAIPELKIARPSGGSAPVGDHGVISAVSGKPAELAAFAAAFIDAIRQHRHFDRFPGSPKTPRPPGRKEKKRP